MLVITNRNINSGHFQNTLISDQNSFGDSFDQNNPTKLRFLQANRLQNRWEVKMIQESSEANGEEAIVKAEFDELVKKCTSRKKHCLFLIHGYNTTFSHALETAHTLEQSYGLEVVLFTWPSRPGGLNLLEYLRARNDARNSFNVLNYFFNKYSSQIKELARLGSAQDVNCYPLTVNLLIHSLGGYLFENYIRNIGSKPESKLMFDNIILLQADVFNSKHRKWVENISARQRVYITLNENDRALILFAQRGGHRLGSLIRNLNAKNASYFDFTRGRGVGITHVIWNINNSIVREFFSKAFTGQNPETMDGFRYNSKLNLYRIRQNFLF